MPAVLLSILLSATAAKGSSEADRLFREARELIAAGKAAEACPLLEKSHALEPALGTLLNLADCQERTGHLVQAYLHFNEAAGWAQRMKESKREQVAHERAAALQTRLAWLAFSSSAPVKGLVVSGAGFRVELGNAPESIPVDPGEVQLTAEAPGYQPWSTHLKIGPAESRQVTVPALVPLAPVATQAPAPRASDVPAASSPLMAPAELAPFPTATAHPVTEHPRGAVPLIGAGSTAVVAGLTGLIWSFSTYGAFQCQQPGGSCAGHPTVTLDDLHTLQWVYPASWVAVGVGAAAVASGVIWYAKGSQASVAWVPTPGGSTVALSGTF